MEHFLNVLAQFFYIAFLITIAYFIIMIILYLIITRKLALCKKLTNNERKLIAIPILNTYLLGKYASGKSAGLFLVTISLLKLLNYFIELDILFFYYFKAAILIIEFISLIYYIRIFKNNNEEPLLKNETETPLQINDDTI